MGLVLSHFADVSLFASQECSARKFSFNATGECNTFSKEGEGRVLVKVFARTERCLS